MKFIFLSTRQYEADFRRFLLEALSAAGHEAWHVRIGHCNKLTGMAEREEFRGVAGLLKMIRRLRVIGSESKTVYVDSTGAVTPVRSILFRLVLPSGTWCFDIFDNLLYNHRGFRSFRTRTAIRLLAWCSRILLVLSSESLRLFPRAKHLDNAANIPRVNRDERNFRDLVILFSIDERFDFDFVSEIARLSPERKIIIHGSAAQKSKTIERRLAELCARQTNVVYMGRYGFDDVAAILDPYAIGLTPYVVGSGLTEFINPDKYYLFLQSGLEVISTSIPQAQRMGDWLHVVDSPVEVLEVAQRIEQDGTFRKNRGMGPEFSWRERAEDLVDIVDAVEAEKVRVDDGECAVPTLADTANEPVSLKVRALRGGIARLCGQAANFALRLVLMVVLARLLSPRDFGLMAMVTVVTGFFELFTSAGLSTATIQKAAVTNQQISTLFWINIVVGIVLGALCLLTAPILAKFFHEPRVFRITVVMSLGFLINAAGVQHGALLSRQLRYLTLTIIEVTALLISLAAGIGMALADFGYWALVGSALALTTAITVGVWLASGWIPGMPRWDEQIRSMLRFGGIVTINSIVVYCAYNLEKVLLGRFWGPSPLGIYGRAYQIVNLPTSNINATVGSVAFSVLSRLQHDAVRYKRYFLKSYSMIAGLTIPITIFSALHADDIVLVVLGAKWIEAGPVLQLLAPTVLVFGLINPMGWFLASLGLQVRSLILALIIAPLVLTACFIGLPYGPTGVAFAYSTALLLWLIPQLVWCVHGTMLTPKDLLIAVGPTLIAGVAAALVGWTAEHWIAGLSSPIARLMRGACVTFVSYYCMLLFVLGQKAMYFDVLRELLAPIVSGIRDVWARKLASERV
jgi:O-antigen/teichoic acid export membrane protein